MKRNVCKRGIFGVFVIVVVVIMVYCAKVKNNEGFWDFTVGNGLTLLVALVVSFYFTQLNIDERNKKEIYLQQLERLQLIVSKECLYKIDLDTDIEKLLMMKRKINNCTTVLKDRASEFDLQGDMGFIIEKVTEYTNLIGEHQDDLEYLSKSSHELERPLDLIEQKLNEMKLKLFD